jgi:phosphate:Na+ symporter
VFWPLLVKASKRLAGISDDAEKLEKARSLDPILLDTPPVALEQCYKQVADMTRLVRENITAAFATFIDKNLNEIKKIERTEASIDDLQTRVTSYLVELSRRALSINESRAIPRLIHCINDAERSGDLAENLCELTELQINKELTIPDTAKADLQKYFDLVDRQFEAVIHALETKDADSVSLALQLEEKINGDFQVLFDRHVTRLDDGTCTVHTGVVVMDVASNLEKIGDHLTNIAERVEIEN